MVLGQLQQVSVSPGHMVQVGAIMVGSMGVDSLSGDVSVCPKKVDAGKLSQQVHHVEIGELLHGGPQG